MFRTVAILAFVGLCLLLAMPVIFAAGKWLRSWWKSLAIQSEAKPQLSEPERPAIPGDKDDQVP